MAITGFTGSSQLDDSVGKAQIAKRVISTAYARAVMDNFVGALGGHDFITGSKIRSYTRLGKITAGDLTEGTDATPTALSDSQRSITVSERGIGTDYGDVLEVANSNAGGMQRIADQLARGYADWVELKELALATSFTGQVGVSNAAMTLNFFLQAILTLEAAEVDGPYFSILPTTPIHTLRTILGGTPSTSVLSAVFMRDGVLDRIGPAMSNSFVMTLYEVDVFKSTNCPLNASSVDKVGVMLPMNEFFPIVRLIGQAPGKPAWDGRYEEQRDASARLTEMWVTGLWATDTLALDYGCGITSVL